MRKLGPSASLVSAVTLLTILGLALPVSAEQAETAPPGVAVADGERSARRLRSLDPNFQIYGGFLVSFARRAPMLDIDIRYVRAANRGVDLGGFRIGTGVRYGF